MPGKSITRTLYVKKVRYASGRQQNFVPPDIHTLLSQALSYTGTVGDRHVPPPGNLQDVDRCGFINRSHNVTNGGLMLEFCSYQPGHSPMQGEADFDRDQIDVKAEPLTDPDTGTKREMLTVASCYAFGQAMIVEAPKGSGGVGWLQKCLTELVRRHIDHQHPSIHLMDVAQHGLTETIERGGGVSEVIMDLEHAAAPEDSKYAKSLSEIRTKLRGTDLLRASFRTKNGTLRTEDVIDAYDEM
ncbi:MAG TPA: hypothetical protein VKA64_09980, partial [Gammaproteobacteria bacterium]|nr:hypothetical protein [Gammaproteobacteria bacterium]